MKIWPHYDYAEINGEVSLWSKCQESSSINNVMNILVRKLQYNIKAYYKAVQITKSYLGGKTFSNGNYC